MTAFFSLQRVLKLVFYSLGVMLALGQAESSFAQTQSATQSVNQLLQAYEQDDPALSNAEKAFQQAIEDLYFLSPTAWVWLGKDVTRQQVEQALLNLEQAEQQGLHPQDYGAAILRRAWNALLCQKNTDLEAFSRFDIALSIAQLHWLTDLHYGRIQPDTLQFEYPRQAALEPLVTLMLSATRHNQVDRLAAQAEPAYQPYRALKTALSHYRQLTQSYAEHDYTFSESVEPGYSGPQINQLKQTLLQLGFLTQSALEHDSAAPNAYTGAVVEAVRQFQTQHGLIADGVIGKRTLAALNVPLKQRITQIELAMERWRWLPALQSSQALILVNIPAFRLWVYPQGNLQQTPDLTMKVIVGRAKENQTPVFMGRLQYLEFGPYWNIPWKIATEEILPALQKNPDYLAQHNMELVADFHHNTEPVPATENIAEAVRKGQIHIRQRPGPRNALGRIKFIFPNSHAVYLHDTPARRLFAKSRRDLSHGCIRVERPKQLADYILAYTNNWQAERVKRAFNAHKHQRVRVKQPVQVVLFYNTAQVIDGKVYFFNDIYHFDPVLAARLQQHYRLAEQTVKHRLAVLLPGTHIPGIKMDEPTRIIANAAAP